jgi:acetolactate synthase-1/2/3 large subunit
MGQFVNENEQLLLQESSRTELKVEGVLPERVVQPAVYEASDLLVAYLADIGVEYVFGIPGGAIEPLYNALARSERTAGPRAIVARHETGAAFMAHGYYRNSGKLGVCCATTGPGTTNLITGVASAYENSVPLLVITAQTALKNFGRKALQESSDTGVNTVGMFQFCTGYNTMISHVDQFEQKLIAAVMTAISSSCPVHLSIPLDILRSPLSIDRPSYDANSLLRAPHMQDDIAVEELCRQLQQAENIVFVLGDACYEAIALILRVAFKLRARIVTTPGGKGMISPYHPLYRGVIGFAGHDSAEEALLDADVDTVVAVGTTLGEWSSNGWDVNAVLNRRLIHIEPLESNLTRSPMARLHVRGRLFSIFETLGVRLESMRTDQDGEAVRHELEEMRWKAKSVVPWHRNIDDDRAGQDREGWEQGLVKPPWLMAYLTRLFPPSTKYLADSGSSVAWAIHYLHPFDRRILERRNGGPAESSKARVDHGRRGGSGALFQAALEFSSMGWAIGAAVGAALASPRQTIVCITGDGSMLMSGQEMTVARQQGLSVVFIVLNDSALGMVKHGQRLAGSEAVGFELPDVDFSAMASAMGIRAYRISCPQELMALSIDQIIHSDGPTLLDIRIDPEAIPPMGLRMKVLQ